MIGTNAVGSLQAAGLAALVLTDNVQVWHCYAFAIVSIIGLLSLARAGDVRHKGRYLLGGKIMYVVLVVSFTRMDVFLAALACLATAGLFHSVARAVNTSMF